MSAYSRIEGHRKIHSLLDDLLKEKIHALSIVYK
jgi:stress-induced morphogen